MAKVAFIGGKVFDSDTESFIEANVVCDKGYIESIGEYIPDVCERIYLDGKYLIPGLIDVHTHGIAGCDFNWAGKEDLKKMCHRYAKCGTTSVMATLASQTPTRLTNAVFAINASRLVENKNGANILGVHLEGRYLNPEKKGAHNEEYLAEPNLEELEGLGQAMQPAPMHFSLAPEMNGAEAFIKRVKELGGTVGIAHTNATYEEAEAALDWGATSFTHTFNAMTPIHHRMPGATVCALTSNRAYAEVIADGEHLHPAIVNLIYKSKPADKMVLITDSMAATGEPDGEYSIAGSPVTVVNGRAIILPSGTIAGSTLTLFKGLTNFMKFCKVPLTKALKYATTNPARMVGASLVGQISKNYRADFIVINDTESPEIESVYVGANKIGDVLI